MICPSCRKATMKETTETHRFVESGLKNVVVKGAIVHTCSGCGERSVGFRNLTGLHRSLALKLIEKPGRLAGAEIRFLRKSLGWSGADFARKVHSDPATVSKWETGRQKMGDRTELLLRALVALGQKIDDYAEHDLENMAVGSAAPLKVELTAHRGTWIAA